MRVPMLLEMAAQTLTDRVGVTGDSSWSYAALHEAATTAGTWLAGRGVERVGFVGENSEAVPVALFGSALAGLPFVPVNYRLADDELRATLERISPAVVVADEGVPERVGAVDGVELVERRAFLERARTGGADDAELSEGDPEDVAWLLFTSGTSGEPKAAVLRHRHLTSYVLGTVEFMSAGDDEASLVSVPPYHVAGLMAVLSGVYSGRRICYLPSFSPEAWVRVARDERVTHAMVVPTMLGRIVEVVEREGDELPDLRTVSYGGGRMPVTVIERALELLPHVDFVNAYGLTETSSTISVLTPDDHRLAMASEDPEVRRRLGSVGRPLPTVEVQIYGPDGAPLPPGEVGEIWVRGEQVSGEYLGRGSVTEGGWLPTRDRGWLDGEGFLYVEGRLDDVIVRGAENMSPGEIEDVLLQHPGVADAAVVGLPDEEWGERVAAAVVRQDGAEVTVEDLQDWVRARLRSSRTPEMVEFRDELPRSSIGKLLRRVLREEMA